MQGASPLASPRLNPRGTGLPCRCGVRRGFALFAACQPCQSGTRRGACLSPRPPTLPLALFLPPSPPAPFPHGEGGIQSFLMQGAKPLASPGLNPRGTGLTCQSGTRRVCLRNRQLGAKAIEPPFYWQCRQPRRGGTGGDGTIRRKRRRRLRWSSPPGQG